MSRTEGRRPELLLVCAAAGVIGTVAPVGLNLVAATIAQHDFMADTISDLGRGPHKWIMDTGFYLNAAGLTCLAVGAAHAHLGRFWWSLGIFAILATAAVTTMLGLYDTFGQGQDMSIHTRLTFLLGPLYAIAPLCLTEGLARRMRLWFIASAALWLIFATAFKLAPDGIDGGLEKLAFLVTALWTLQLSALFWRLGRENASAR